MVAPTHEVKGPKMDDGDDATGSDLRMTYVEIKFVHNEAGHFVYSRTLAPKASLMLSWYRERLRIRLHEAVPKANADIAG